MIGVFNVVSGDETLKVYAETESEAREIAETAWKDHFDQPLPKDAQIESSGTMTDIDDFMEKYTVKQNTVSHDDASFCNTLFETYGPEVEYIQSVASRFPMRVWTLLETDGDHGLVVNGMHHVNRQGYFVTEEDGSNEEEVYYVE